MLLLDDELIAKVNSEDGSGRLLKTVILTETTDPLVKKYFVDNAEPIVFQGNTYTPLHMVWQNVKVSQSSATESAMISVSNIDGQVAAYLKEIDISGNEVIIQLLHEDLLSTLENYWWLRSKVLASRYDELNATFDIGRQLGKNRLPRGVILKSKYPGISSDVPRIF